MLLDLTIKFNWLFLIVNKMEKIKTSSFTLNQVGIVENSKNVKNQSMIPNKLPPIINRKSISDKTSEKSSVDDKLDFKKMESQNTPIQTNPKVEIDNELPTEKKLEVTKTDVKSKSRKSIIHQVKIKTKSKSKTTKRKEYDIKIRPEMSLIERITDVRNIRKAIKDLCNELSSKTVDSIKFIIINNWKNVIRIMLSINIKMGLSSFKVLGDLYLEFDLYDNAKSTFFFYVFI